jgi:hypothetical protein
VTGHNGHDARGRAAGLGSSFDATVGWAAM